MVYDTYRALPPDPIIDALIAERRLRGWTQRKVARQILNVRGKPYGQTSLSAWERRINDVGLYELRQWCFVLDVTLTIGQGGDLMVVEGDEVAPHTPEVRMAQNIAGQSLSGGWEAKVIRYRGDSHEWDTVVEDTELATVLAAWLDLLTNTDADIATIEQLGELIGDSRSAEEIAADPDDAPWWTIPLNVDRLGELVTGGRYLCSEFSTEDDRYQILIDYTDF